VAPGTIDPSHRKKIVSALDPSTPLAGTTDVS
jgi:hypothetical protein